MSFIINFAKFCHIAHSWHPLIKMVNFKKPLLDLVYKHKVSQTSLKSLESADLANMFNKHISLIAFPLIPWYKYHYMKHHFLILETSIKKLETLKIVLDVPEYSFNFLKLIIGGLRSVHL